MTSHFLALSILFQGLFASVQTIPLANQWHDRVSHSAKPPVQLNAHVWALHLWRALGDVGRNAACRAPRVLPPRRHTPRAPASVAPFDGQQPVGNGATWLQQSVTGWRERESWGRAIGAEGEKVGVSVIPDARVLTGILFSSGKRDRERLSHKERELLFIWQPKNKSSINIIKPRKI